MGCEALSRYRLGSVCPERGEYKAHVRSSRNNHFQLDAQGAALVGMNDERAEWPTSASGASSEMSGGSWVSFSNQGLVATLGVRQSPWSDGTPPVSIDAA